MEEAEKTGKDAITINKNTLWKLTAFVFAVLFLIALFTGGFSGNSTGNAIDNNGNDGSEGTTVTVQINDNDPVLGNENAKISIVEFSDFECPFCGRAATGALAEFKQSDYFKNGEVNLIYKHFPLSSIHPDAQKAAEASECASLQGKFWEYHDTLFAHQNALSITDLKQYANNLGLDTAAFNSCLDNGDTRSDISKDVAQGTASGARGTPYFVIVNHENGKTQAVSGALPWAQFEAAIGIVQ